MMKCRVCGKEAYIDGRSECSTCARYYQNPAPVPKGLPDFMHMLYENATEGHVYLDDLCSMYGFDWDGNIEEITKWFKNFGVKL